MAGSSSPVPHEHGRFDYSPIVDRKPLRWPNGARVAVCLSFDVDNELLQRANPLRQTTGAICRKLSRAAD